MADRLATTAYLAMLRARFSAYRRDRFADADHIFKPYPEGGPIVFRPEHAQANLLVPPFATSEQRDTIISAVPVSQRHRHFASMQSSQALAQSVFGTIGAFGLLPELSRITAECGQPAFGLCIDGASIRLEEPVRMLGEPRPTSVDVWLGGPRVAVECKLAEAEFGTCSRPRLTPKDKGFAAQHCDGSYARQRGRATRCSLTEIHVGYWQYMEGLFGWNADTDHRPCPLAYSYQLARNVMAASVSDEGALRLDHGHALVMYDRRNPTMGPGGQGDRQWQASATSLREPSLLRRLSWQGLLEQWPTHHVLDWLKAALDEKYGIA